MKSTMAQEFTEKLAPMEFALMDAVRSCKDDAFGAKIWKAIEDRTGRSYSSGSVYTGLNRLVSQDFIEKSKGVDGKHYYKLTEKGKRVMFTSRQSYQRLVENTADLPSSWGVSPC